LELESQTENVLVSNEGPQQPADKAIYRGQSPDAEASPVAQLVPVKAPASGRSVYAESSYAEPTVAVPASLEVAETPAPPSEPIDWHPAGTRGLREQQPVALEAANLASQAAGERPAALEVQAAPTQLMAGQYAISPPFSSLAKQRGHQTANQDYADAPTGVVRRKPIRDAGSEAQTLRR
jgi:hypothetical protein